MTHDLAKFSASVRRPVNDGMADHLWGLSMPALALGSTSGETVRVDQVPAGFERMVIYAYPMTGRPGVELPAGWDDIPGARGCTPEACGFRDHEADLAEEGASVVGVSTQSTPYQKEAVDRLGLPFALLSDSELELTRALRLPTFWVDLGKDFDRGAHRTLLKRLTLVVAAGVIEQVFYPVFSPGTHAQDVVGWLRRTRQES